MAISSSLQKSYDVQPEVRFGVGRGLILIAGDAEHRVFNPTLEAMLRKYLDCSESRASTREWIEERNECSSFSFAALCEYLELDADWLRSGLIRWMDNIETSSLDTTKSKDFQPTDQSLKTRVPNISPSIRRDRLSWQPVARRRSLSRRSYL